MNSDKIYQCKEDIAKLQEELKNLQEITFSIGDVVECDTGGKIITFLIVGYYNRISLIVLKSSDSQFHKGHIWGPNAKETVKNQERITYEELNEFYVGTEFRKVESWQI